MADNPSGTPEYYRTMWVDNVKVGMGFQRKTNTFYTPAFDGVDDASAGDQIVTNPASRFEVVDSFESFKRQIEFGGSATVEGWGGSGSVDYAQASMNSYSSRKITCTLRRDFVSQPKHLIQPSIKPVSLSEDAKKLLRKEGPVAFREKYGSHFVAGCVYDVDPEPPPPPVTIVCDQGSRARYYLKQKLLIC